MHRHFHSHEHRGRHAWGGMGRHHGRMRGGRIGRFLEHGDLRFVVLGLIAEQPRHGYDLIRELEDRTGGAYRPSPGVIYPTLSLLEDEGFVSPVAAEGGRKLFEITTAGREALERERASVEAVFACMAEARADGAGAGPRVQRAMKNLAAALSLRMAQGAMSAEAVDAIVQAIDETAARVERA